MSASCCDCKGPRCQLSPDDKRHGTPNGYNNQHCRCEPCRAANTVYMAERKALRIARGVPDHVHGTSGGYGNWDCRCDDCTAAWTKETRDRNGRRRRGDTACARGEMAYPKRRDKSLIAA